MPIHVYGPRDKIKIPAGSISINTTCSKNTTFARELSPMLLGPCPLYGDYISRNMENAWQYSKVYEQFLDDNGDPSPEYFEWATKGWTKDWADRYPMGKGAMPAYSYWDGQKLDYIQARKRIYLPLYAYCVRRTDAYSLLYNMKGAKINIWLWDFDGYNYEEKGMSLNDVLHCETLKMGHAFVLAMMLKGLLPC